MAFDTLGMAVPSRDPELEPFIPHPLLSNPHLQTLLPLFAPLPDLAVRVERFDLPDGDFIDVGWAGEEPGRPTAVLVHGLAGGMRSRYILRMAAELVAAGWTVALFQLRGAGGQPNRLARSYHHGDTEDFRWFCRRLRFRSRAAVAAVGWSLGAGVVLKALGEDGADSPLDCAVAVSAPFELHSCARYLAREGRLYQSLLLRELKRNMLLKHRSVAVPEHVDLVLAEAAADFLAFGAAYTAPINGFGSIRDYCRVASCGPYLAGIRRPTVVFQSIDDPVLGPQSVRPPPGLPACVKVAMSDHGGHAGFVAAGPRGVPLFWLEQQVPRQLALLSTRRRAARGRREQQPSRPMPTRQHASL